MGFELGPRRGMYIDISGETKEKQPADEAIMYRSLCAMLYNYVPMSGHPGGSISSGRFVSGIVFNHLDYDVANPDRWDALKVIRGALEKNPPMVAALAQKLRQLRHRLDSHTRKPRPQAPAVQAVFDLAAKTAGRIPAELTLTPGKSATLRGELGRTLSGKGTTWAAVQPIRFWKRPA